MLVDIGCGEGEFLRIMLNHRLFTQVVGLDICDESLEKAKYKVEPNGSDYLEYRQMGDTWQQKVLHGTETKLYKMDFTQPVMPDIQRLEIEVLESRKDLCVATLIEVIEHVDIDQQ